MRAMLKVGFVPSVRSRGSMPPWCVQMRDEGLAALRAIDGWEVLAPGPSPDGQTRDPLGGLTPAGVVSDLDDADTMAAYFAREGVDALVLCPLNFGDERSAAKIVERLRVPVLLYATKEPPAVQDRSLARVSDSYCGNLSMASGLYRRKLPFYYAGLFFPTEPALQVELEAFCRAALVVKSLTQARIGHIGVRPPTFETVAYDETAMLSKFGQNVIYANLSDVTDAALSLASDDPRVLAVLADTRASMAEITVSEHYLLNAARFEVALAEFWRANRLAVMAAQCWPSVQRLMGISLCAIFGRLTNKGMLTACEVDVLGSLAMLAGYAAAKRDTVPHFIDWTIQHRDDANVLLAWHCGNAPVSLAADPSLTALRSRHNMAGVGAVPERDPQAGLAQFQLRPGPVTFCRLAEYDGQWKMLIARGEIEPSDETLAGTWAWVHVRDHARLYRTLVEEGFVHHASMSYGDQAAALQLACRYLDITPVVVD
jgi:L-fucose isomerase-like protein